MSPTWPLRARAHAIDDKSWQQALRAYPFALAIGAERLGRVRALAGQFLASKRFAAEGGLPLTDAIGVAIALQACLPVAELGLRWYDDFEQIILYPDEFRVERRMVDENGVVHEFSDVLAGESMDGGPIVLSWADTGPRTDAQGPGPYNVVIHEFLHKLDLRDGEADGVPPLPAGQRAAWQRSLDLCFDRFVTQVESIERAIPPGIDPESDAADPWYAMLPLDSYAAEDPAEFFAVAGEAFFMSPDVLDDAFPEFFHALQTFFGFAPSR